jgi:hypothetical protein
MNKNLNEYNKMIDRTALEFYQRSKFNGLLSEEYFNNFPLKLLDIAKIYRSLKKTSTFDTSVGRHLSEKLIDIKTLFFFLDNSMDKFYLGTTVIVGNGELHKVNERSISLIQHNHYKVYLIVSLYEKLLDFFILIYFGKMIDSKKDKWGKLFKKLTSEQDFDFISTKENTTMLEFREKVRRGELHGFSSVFRQLFKDRWDHFQLEEDILRSIIKKVYEKF